MPAIRKTVRDAVVSVLSAGSTGFNARFATTAGTYQIRPMELDWGNGSASVFYGQVPGQVEVSQLDPAEWAPLGLMVYTTTVQNAGREKPRVFSGDVELVLDFSLQVRDGAEKDDIESVSDAVEDVVIECLYDLTAAWPPSVVLSQDFVSVKQEAELIGDGWSQRLVMSFKFGVSL